MPSDGEIKVPAGCDLPANSDNPRSERETQSRETIQRVEHVSEQGLVEGWDGADPMDNGSTPRGSTKPATAPRRARRINNNRFNKSIRGRDNCQK